MGHQHDQGPQAGVAIRFGSQLRPVEQTATDQMDEKTLLRVTAPGWQDSLDNPNGPPEPAAQVRVLPGALLPGRSLFPLDPGPAVIFVVLELPAIAKRG